ncbi:MAG: hypothetical protein M1812_004329 [Candelaria pacifica]|nr:MAG: hypothetical protein M1812_004329 [Candelaria pacifica]
MAVEKAKASGLKVEMVVVGDDVGVGRTKSGKVGRRGIAGIVLVHKVAGALAATGAPLEEVHRVAQLVAHNIVSVGASLSHVHVPGRALPDPTSDEILATEEIEIGMGIHNEPGSHRASVDLPELVKTLLAQLLNWKDEDRAFLPIDKSDPLVLLVNNLGGLSVLELGGVTAEVVEQLDRDYGIKPMRILSGTYMTSLNGLGFSVTLLKLVETDLGPGRSMLDLLHAPAEASGWPSAIQASTWDNSSSKTEDHGSKDEENIEPSSLTVDPDLVRKALTKGLERLIAAEPDVTNYDTIAGDGDCGIGLKRGAEAILKFLERTKLSNDAVVIVSQITQVVESNMDGTSGAIYAIFLNALVNALRKQAGDFSISASPQIWARALQLSLESLGGYTPAQPGDRTLVDALHPFVETLGATGDIKQAAEAASKGAQNTRSMKASLGRTVYIGGEDWQGVPDPGAHGLSEFLTGLAAAL